MMKPLICGAYYLCSLLINAVSVSWNACYYSVLFSFFVKDRNNLLLGIFCRMEESSILIKYSNPSIYVVVDSKKRRRKSNLILLTLQSSMFLTRNLKKIILIYSNSSIYVAIGFKKRRRKFKLEGTKIWRRKSKQWDYCTKISYQGFKFSRVQPCSQRVLEFVITL